MPRSNTPFDGRSMGWLRASACGLVAMASVGCGELQPGDHLVVRIAESSETRTDGCYYPNDEPPQSLISDSTTVLRSATLVVYNAGGDTRILDSGSATLQGVQNGDQLSFTGSGADAIALGEVALQTTTTTLTVGFTLDGDVVKGTRRSEAVTVCEFLTATPSGEYCPNPPIPDCLIETVFDGVVIDDVRLSRSISNPSTNDD